MRELSFFDHVRIESWNEYINTPISQTYSFNLQSEEPPDMLIGKKHEIDAYEGPERTGEGKEKSK